MLSVPDYPQNAPGVSRDFVVDALEKGVFLPPRLRSNS
jgi:hypothetical protein